MTFTNVGKELVALSIGSNLDLFIGHIGIGSGSGTALSTNTTLFGEERRVSVTGSPDTTVAQKVAFQADFNSVTMSGIALSEFGLFNVASGTGYPGSVWSRNSFGSVIFDGTNELQVTETIHVF